MRLIQRYILFELLKIFSITLTILTLLFVLGGLVREGREQGLEPAQVLQLVPFILPDALRFTVPATILLAACMVYGRMSNSNEITALKSLGVSPLAVLWPVFIFSFLLSLATVWLNDFAVSWGRAGIRRVVIESIEEIAYGMLRTQRSYSSELITIVVKRVDDQRLIQPVISFKAGASDVIISCEEAELRGEPEKGLFTVICRNGMIDVEGKARMLFPNDTIERSVPLDQGRFKGEADHPAYMAMHQIPGAISSAERSILSQDDVSAAKAALQLLSGDFLALTGVEWETEEELREREVQKLHRLQTEPYRRWSNGFSCLCFVLVGAPLAVRLRNADFLSTFALCFLPILIVYYPLLAFGVDQAKAGRVPSYTVWVGNVLLFGVGAYLIHRVRRY
jgi:lipopolysaccharide export system permease protein